MPQQPDEPSPRATGWGWAKDASLLTHLLGALLAAVVVVSVVGPSTSAWGVAVLAGWITAAGTFLGLTWWAVWRLDAAGTADHAQREDPSRSVADLVLLGAAVISLLTVVLVIFRARESGPLQVGLGVLSVAASWAVVPTLFTLRYTREYYAAPTGGVDFRSDGDPTYRDFAYVAFTVGMTFQVSDTDLTTSAMRASVLRQALISYVFGAIILAVTLNLVAGLSSGG